MRQWERKTILRTTTVVSMAVIFFFSKWTFDYCEMSHKPFWMGDCMLTMSPAKIIIILVFRFPITYIVKNFQFAMTFNSSAIWFSLWNTKFTRSNVDCGRFGLDVGNGIDRWSQEFWSMFSNRFLFPIARMFPLCCQVVTALLTTN